MTGRLTGRQGALIAVLVLVALVLQETVVSRLPLPGYPPDLLLVVVLAVALAAGPVPGMITGFAAGAGTDLLADHALGRLALAWVVAACLAGLASGEDERAFLQPFGAVAGGTAAALCLYALEGLLLSDPRVSAGATAIGLLSCVPYSVVLVPLVVPLVDRLLRRPGGAVHAAYARDLVPRQRSGAARRRVRL